MARCLELRTLAELVRSARAYARCPLVRDETAHELAPNVVYVDLLHCDGFG